MDMVRAKLHHYRRALDKKNGKNFGFVTISRQAGAGGITVGKKLAAYLNEVQSSSCPWTVFDKDLVGEVARDHNLSDRMLPFLKEGKIPEIADTATDLLRLRPTQLSLVQITNKTIAHLAETGHTIIVGRGASVVTKDLKGGVHVRLVGSFQKRKEHVMDYYDFDDKEAADFIKNEDRGRAEYLKKYFNSYIDDPLLYDLVINTDDVSYEAAASIIAQLIMKKAKTQQRQRSTVAKRKGNE